MVKKVKLSESGPSLSRVVSGVMTWGVWGSDLSTAGMQQLIEHGLQLGMTTFDHADIYGHYTTEAAFGAVLKENPGLRDQMEVITKCGIRLVTSNRPGNQLKSYHTGRDYILKSVEQSLLNLHTDRIDLLLIHRPEPLMEPEEVAEAFHRLKRDGKVLHFGVSNFNRNQFALLAQYVPLCTNQIELSLMRSEPMMDGEMEFWMRQKIRPMAWSPIGGGVIFGQEGKQKYTKLWEVIDRLGAKYSASPDQLLLAWLMRHPAVVLPVVGTTKVDRLTSAAQAAQIQLEREDWYAMWEGARGHEVP